MKHMDEERDIDTSGFRGGKRFMPVRIRCNQAIAIHNDPLVGICCTVSLNPLHFTPSVTGRDYSDYWLLPKAISESQYSLLLRRGQATDRFENGFFDAHASAILMIPELPFSRGYLGANRCGIDVAGRTGTPCAAVPANRGIRGYVASESNGVRRFDSPIAQMTPTGTFRKRVLHPTAVPSQQAPCYDSSRLRMEGCPR